MAAPDGLRPRIYCWLARKPDHAEPGTVCFGHVELVRVANYSWIGASGLEMVAVQFRSNVYLTDGWMVPDRILWYSLASEHIRPAAGTKKAAAAKKAERALSDY